MPVDDFHPERKKSEVQYTGLKTCPSHGICTPVAQSRLWKQSSNVLVFFLQIIACVHSNLFDKPTRQLSTTLGASSWLLWWSAERTREKDRKKDRRELFHSHCQCQWTKAMTKSFCRAITFEPDSTIVGTKWLCGVLFTNHLVCTYIPMSRQYFNVNSEETQGPLNS